MALKAIVREVENNLQGQEHMAPLSADVLKLVFKRLMSVQDIGSCAIVCRQWRAVIAKNDDLWKRCALEKVLGKRVWEENVYVDVGEEPCFRIGGHAISWRDVCKIQREPSFFRAAKGKMIEVDFLVPKTMNGQPTTIKRVLEVFAKAKKPIGCRYIDPDFLSKHGDRPLKESYFARITFTVDEETRLQKPEERVEIIMKVGQGLYRFPYAIEHMIYSFLAHQIEAPFDYGQSPTWTYTQYLEMKVMFGFEYPTYRVEYPMMGGGFEVPTSNSSGGLSIDFVSYVDKARGAGALRMF